MCSRWAKLNAAYLHSSIVTCLVWLYNATENGETDADGFIHFENYLVQRKRSNIKGVIGKAKYWGLVERRPKDESEAHKKTSGHWRLTEKGKRFVRGEISVPRKIWYFDDRVVDIDDPQDLINIKTSEIRNFDYEQVMKDYYGQRKLL